MRGEKMKMHIKEFAKLCGVSVRTLHYYDEIGLLKPSETDKFTGYRFYDENSLLRMQEILFYRELDFSLSSIKEILSSKNYDKEKALSEQKKLLVLKKERLENLISAIDGAMRGENIMNAFNNSEFEKYKAEAKERWGETKAYKEYEEKSKNSSFENMASGLNDIFSKFALCMKKRSSPDCVEAQSLVKELQDYITENFYTCTNEILSGLSQMYVYDERFKNNIDKNAQGTAQFVSEAIKKYCE